MKRDTESIKGTGRTSSSERKRLETEIKASCGHSWNQLIAVQLTKAGNFRARTLSVEPTGEKHNITLRSRRTLSMKNFQQFSRESNKPAPLTCIRKSYTIIVDISIC